MMSFVAGLASVTGVAGTVAGSGALHAVIQETPGMAPLPASPPIGGAIWTVLVPAILFLGSFLGTYLLYRRFAEKEGEG